MLGTLYGLYGGIVRENGDPQRLGRLKVHVPTVYGVAGPDTQELGIDDLPWAWPSGMPAGGTAASGGVDWLPNVGDHVWVRFLNGEPEHPVWEWGSQDVGQAKVFPLHDYDAKTGKPKRAAITRYGHTLDFTASGVILTTKGGYAIAIDDSATQLGSITIRSPGGHSVKVDDAASVVTLESRAGQAITLDDLANSVRVQANQDLDVQAMSEANIQGGSVTIEALGESVDIKVGLTAITLADGELTLDVGGNKLTISDSGFDFSGI
jgi:hypothetical protein